MIYDKRNRANIDKLADNTKAAALKWYEYLVKEGIEILIYETIRSLETQKAYVAKGASQTLRSYHLVGQALDFVPVNSKGESNWAGYGGADVKKAVAKAKALGFEWGGDWTSFIDKPHIQFNYRGYGTDTFNGTGTGTDNSNVTKDYLEKGDKGADVKELQNLLVKAGYKIAIDGDYGNATEEAVKKFQKAEGLEADGVYGKKTEEALKAATKPKKEKEVDVSKYPTIRRGSQGSYVVKLQNYLLSFGYTIGKADGIFGEKVENAVEALQKSNDLKADGIVGKNTWKAIVATPASASKALAYKKGKVTGDVWVHSKADFKDSTRSRIIEKGETVRIYGEKNSMYSIGDNAYVSKKYIKIV